MNFLFIDLETTGLSVAQDKIVEIGMVVTNHLFTPVDSFNIVVSTEPEDWTLAHQMVIDMHGNNGLMQESLDSTIKVDEAEEFCMRFVGSCRWLGPQPVMCGNTVHFDRAFLNKYTPNFHDLFHYRNFDVSTLKQLIRAVDPKCDFIPDNEIHRAIPDCFEAAALAGDILALFSDVLNTEGTRRTISNWLVRPDEG